MFVAEWRWNEQVEAWDTTSQSFNLSTIESLWVQPDSLYSHGDHVRWSIVAFTTGDHQRVIASDAPTEQHCLELLGLILEGPGGGRWPAQDAIPFQHQTPGSN